MKKLYIVTFYNDASDVDRDVEWFWAESEAKAVELFEEYIKEIGIGETEIIDTYEVVVPEDVKDEIVKEYQENEVEDLSTYDEADM